MVRGDGLPPLPQYMPTIDTGRPGTKKYVYDTIITYTFEQNGVIKSDTARFDVLGSNRLTAQQVFDKAIEMLAMGESPYPADGLPANYSVDYSKLYLMRVYYVD